MPRSHIVPEVGRSPRRWLFQPTDPSFGWIQFHPDNARESIQTGLAVPKLPCGIDVCEILDTGGRGKEFMSLQSRFFLPRCQEQGSVSTLGDSHQNRFDLIKIFQF